MASTQCCGVQSGRKIELAPILDLNAASPLAGEFLSHRGEEVTVDASRVQRLGGQCLQVLLSAAMTWKADETPLAVVNPSPGFIEWLRRLGLSLADFIDQEHSK
jgi:chemotaxis protein CheX